MVNINLLPWRNQRRARARRAYVAICCFAVIALIVCELCWRGSLLHRQQWLSQQQHALNLATAQLKLRKKEINDQMNQQKQTLASRTRVLNDQARIRKSVRLLQSLSEALPIGAILRLLELNDRSVTMRIIVREDHLVPELLAALLALPELQRLQLQRVQRQKDTPYYDLELVGQLC